MDSSKYITDLELEGQCNYAFTVILKEPSSVTALNVELRLKEGFFGDIWDGLKGLGDKAKEAITGGWNKLKSIWAEFKELVQEVINSAKNGLLKLNLINLNFSSI